MGPSLRVVGHAICDLEAASGSSAEGEPEDDWLDADVGAADCGGGFESVHAQFAP